MDQFEHKSLLTTPYNLTYSYYLSPDFHTHLSPSTPTLLFIHGFPDDALMWSHLMPTMLALPYPIIALDILGLGSSSKPTSPQQYNYLAQANSIGQILDHEGVPKDKNIIPIGHDWGSAIAQRFYLYHRTRCVGLALISLAYQIPSPEPFDLAAANEAKASRFGYPQWEYWNFFTASDAPALMRANLDRFYEVNHGLSLSSEKGKNGRDVWMREMFCTPGAMRAYITRTGRYADFTVPLKEYDFDHEALRAQINDRLGREGATEAAVCYYHSLKDNTMLEEERSLCPSHSEGGEDKRKIDVPVCYIGQTGDWVCRTDLMGDAKREGLVADVEEHVVEAGHWVMYEKPQAIADVLKGWLERRFAVGG